MTKEPRRFLPPLQGKRRSEVLPDSGRASGHGARIARGHAPGAGGEVVSCVPRRLVSETRRDGRDASVWTSGPEGRPRRAGLDVLRRCSAPSPAVRGSIPLWMGRRPDDGRERSCSQGSRRRSWCMPRPRRAWCGRCWPGGTTRRGLRSRGGTCGMAGGSSWPTSCGHCLLMSRRLSRRATTLSSSPVLPVTSEQPVSARETWACGRWTCCPRVPRSGLPRTWPMCRHACVGGVAGRGRWRISRRSRARCETREAFVEALAPLAVRYGKPRGDGAALLGWLLDLTGGGDSA